MIDKIKSALKANPLTVARNRLRAAIFDVTRGKLVDESTALYLLRIVEHALSPPDEVSIGTPDGVRVVTGNHWRAYPCDQTTVRELMLAADKFDLRLWVDLSGAVCLIQPDPHPDNPVPTAAELADAMFIYPADKDLPALMRRQAD